MNQSSKSIRLIHARSRHVKHNKRAKFLSLSTFFILNMMTLDAKWSASFDELFVMEVLVASKSLWKTSLLIEDIHWQNTLCLLRYRLVSIDILFISDTFQNPCGVFGATNSPKCRFAKINAASKITLMLVTFSKSLL